jgi:hypothetical protein
MRMASPYCAAVANAVVYAAVVRSDGIVLKPIRTERGSPAGSGRTTVGPGGSGAGASRHAERNAIATASTSAARMTGAG